MNLILKIILQICGAQLIINTAQKMTLSFKDFSSKCDQSRSFLRIWSHLLKKFLMENFTFCRVKSHSMIHLLKYFTLQYDLILKSASINCHFNYASPIPYTWCPLKNYTYLSKPAAFRCTVV